MKSTTKKKEKRNWNWKDSKIAKKSLFFPLFGKKSFLNRTLGLRKSFLNQTIYVLKNRLHQQSFLNRDSFLNQAFLNRDSTVLTIQFMNWKITIFHCATTPISEMTMLRQKKCLICIHNFPFLQCICYVAIYYSSLARAD